MYEYGALNSLESAAFQGLTYPAFRPLLAHAHADDRCIAIGAWCCGRPMGLALATMPPGHTAEVLSVCVLAAYRRLGVATALFQHLEESLRQRGCGVARVVYTSGTPGTAALKHLLSRFAWEQPRRRMLICKAGQRFLAAPWLHRYRLPSAYQVFPWTAITPQEREMLAKQQVHIPSGLSPFPWEHALEPINSLGLRYHGQVAGWLLTHRIAPDTVRYTCAYVRQELQRMGPLLGLVIEAIRRQTETLGVDSRAIWATPVRHASMVAFICKRMAPYLDSLAESWEAFKLLGKGRVAAAAADQGMQQSAMDEVMK